MMNNDPHTPQSDLWSDWLLRLRHGNDPEYERLVRARIERFVDRVLDGAQLAPGMTLVDVGTGDGILAFRAIDRIGPSLRVLLTDISIPMLRHAEKVAMQKGVSDQCTFIHNPTEHLTDIDESSADVVTTRAVLAYIHDKKNTLEEFYRVLKPGGRISIAEPLLRDEAIQACALKKYVDSKPKDSPDRFLSLMHRLRAAQFPDTKEKLLTSSLTNYTERDLLRFVLDAGFEEVHMEFHVDVIPSIITSWEVFLGSSPHPWAPTPGTIFAEQFTEEERQLFERIYRPGIEAGLYSATERVVYITGRKPLT